MSGTIVVDIDFECEECVRYGTCDYKEQMETQAVEISNLMSESDIPNVAEIQLVLSCKQMKQK